MSASISDDNPRSPMCQDIVNCILDCFATLPENAADRRMLSACSLVRRGWVDYSQKLLLHTILLKYQERINTFISALPSLSDRARRFIRAVRICGPFVLNDAYPCRSGFPFHVRLRGI